MAWGNRVVQINSAHLQETMDILRDHFQFEDDEQLVKYAVVYLLIQRIGRRDEDKAASVANRVARADDGIVDDIMSRINIS